MPAPNNGADEPSDSDDSGRDIKRRPFLSATAATTAGLAGVGAFAGTAAAWKRLDADFKGCSEVWIILSQRDVDCLNENDIPYDELKDRPNNKCPLAVKVVLTDGDGTDGDGTDCVTVETGPENVETIPGQYGDTPLVKYRAPDGEKILGIVGLTPSRNLDKQIVNDHRCTQTPNTPSFYDADCVSDSNGGDGGGTPAGSDDDEAGGESEGEGNGKGGGGKGNGGGNGEGESEGKGGGNGKGNGGGKGEGKGGGNGKGNGNGGGNGKGKGNGGGNGKGKGNGGGNGKGKGNGGGNGKGKGRGAPASLLGSLWPF